VKLRVYLDVADPVTRRRLAALVKADPEIVLVAAAEQADVVVSERVIATAAPATVPREGAALTPRELDVLRLVARGLGNKEIAAELRVYLDVADPVTRRRLAALVKADPEIVLVAAAEQADVVVSERVIATAAPATVPREGAALTPRELDVLRLVARGLGNKEIAAELDLSAHTVKYHLASVLAKLGVRSRAEAVSRGIRTGLLPL